MNIAAKAATRPRVVGAARVIAPAGTPLLPLLLLPPLPLFWPLPLPLPGTTVVALAASFLYSSRDLLGSAVLREEN